MMRQRMSSSSFRVVRPSFRRSILFVCPEQYLDQYLCRITGVCSYVQNM